MKANRSLEISNAAKELLNKDLSKIFYEMFPFEKLSAIKPNKSRDRIYNQETTLLTMILTMILKDKSLQNSVEVYSEIHEINQAKIAKLEKDELRIIEHNKEHRGVGRPRTILSKIAKSKKRPISKDTSGFSQARQRLMKEAIDIVYQESKDFSGIQYDSIWHDRRVFITDGTYLQMQDTEGIKEKFQCSKSDTYPRGLLQVVIEQGSGSIYDFKLDSDRYSELTLFSEMIKNLPSKSLLLADDCYNSFAIFHLLRKKEIDIIVPGKRVRNYKVIKTLAPGDEIVEIYNSNKSMLAKSYNITEKSMQMRRITYKNHMNPAEDLVIYTSILDEEISKEEIILKYEKRWDIEISIREIKTMLDINIIRAKSPDMAYKELTTALIAYNYIRRIIALAAEKSGFSPQSDIFQKFYEDNRTLYVDKLGRKYARQSPGRAGYSNQKGIEIHNSSQTEPTLSKKNKARKI